MTTASQVIMTNTAFFLQKQLEETTKELEEYKFMCNEFRKELSAKYEEIEKLKEQLARGIK